ncbi:MAG: 3-hydroxyacyl-CoA dehydrogenase/enoyl-CoA hydratase family protein [Legionellales bacterium]|nr:3-hydroxyacyl-CoA dehydrogenase/enoyl-CoA hydratase family protein [Legionellales bacterium]
MKKLHIKKVAILGAGTMGAQLAACFANAGIPAHLFDLKQNNACIATTAIANLKKIHPEPLHTKSTADLITAHNYDDDIKLIENADLIIEAVAENLAIKQKLLSKVAPYISKTALLSTNTSGLSIESLASVLPSELQQRFLGTHFFNPPRYLPLVELIPSAATALDNVYNLANFFIRDLGKEVIVAPNSPNFIANRVGLFSLLLTTKNAVKFGIPLEVADALTGDALSRPKSATFRTADVVGLDILASAIKTSHSIEHDPWRSLHVLPEFIETLITKQSLGQKSGRGIYEKRPDGIYVLDLKTMDYRLANKKPIQALIETLKSENYKRKFDIISNANDENYNFVWLTLAELFHYCAWLCMDLKINTYDLDAAIKLGFGWELGPFEMWQLAGVENIRNLINVNLKQDLHNINIPLPEWLDNCADFYQHNQSFNPSSNSYEDIPIFTQRKRTLHLKQTISSPKPAAEIISETAHSKLWTTGDEIAIFSIKTKLATVNQDVLADLTAALKLVANNYQALVIWQENTPNFGAGADLKAIGKKYILRGNKVIEGVITDFQQAVMALKYSAVPTIAAVRGLALGGSCELMLHCSHRVVAFNSYIGLVEAGVGLIPAAGGCKEMATRALTSANPKDQLTKNFQTIAMGKLATSAHMALELGFLLPNDTIIANPNHILHVAKSQAKALSEANYRAPNPSLISAPGNQGIADLSLAIANMGAGNFASEHDCLIATKLAHVMCGGAITAGTKISADYLLKLEQEKFLELLSTWKTKKRIAHILKTGKRLSN